MTKLTRLTAKIFGETATATGDDPEIGQFGSALAGTYVGTTDVATIQSLPAWSNGFIDSVTPSTQFPPLPEMTGFGKVLSYQNAYTLQQGMPEWDSATVYYINNFCSYEGVIYKSLTDSNLNNNPSTDTINWIQYASDGYANQDLSNLNDEGNAKFQRAPFSINIGTLDSNGNNATLYSDVIEGVQTIICNPCTITTADGRTKTFEETSSYSISATPVQVEESWQQPILTSSGTMGSTEYATSASVNSSTSYNAMADSYWGTINQSSKTQWWQFYTQEAIKLKSVTYRTYSASNYTAQDTVSLKASVDGSNWVTLASGIKSKSYNKSSNNNTIVRISCSDNEDYYNYFRITNTTCAANDYGYFWHVKTVQFNALHWVTKSDADGNYSIFKNFETGNLIISNNFTMGNSPVGVTGEYWLDTSSVPLSFKQYNGTTWLNANDYVKIGTATIDSGVLTRVSNSIINRFVADVVTRHAYDLDWDNAILVDSNYTPSQNSIPYTMPDDGVLLVYTKSEGGSNVKTVNAIIYFTSDLNGAQVSSSMYTSGGAYAGVYFPFLKGTTAYYHFNITGTATTRVGRCYFVPFKKEV